MDKTVNEQQLTNRRYRDGDDQHLPWQQEIFEADHTYKCPTYVHRTPPCQGSCPSGEDIRGWLNIARGIEKAPDGMSWQEYAFRRITEANPFPAIMGRVCPAPCEDGCNRNEVEDHVGINSVEHYIGDYALEHGFKLPDPGPDTGKKIAIIGAGPAGLTTAYQMRLRGHACTVFERHTELGGMMRYGIPGYRTPRDVLDGEIGRIIDMGVEVRTNCKIGVDVSLDELEKDFDAIFVGTGAQDGTALAVPGGDADNCISGIAFLDAFNDGRLKFGAGRVLVIGGGDTAMDVAAVARRLGHITKVHEKDLPEYVVLGQTTHDVATVANRKGADVQIVYRRPISKMPAAKMEIEHITKEGVEIQESLIPLEVIKDSGGRATALRVQSVDWSSGQMEPIEGTERDIECDLIVAAIGQVGDFIGMEKLDNGKGLCDADGFYRIPDMEQYYVGGDVVKPHLLTTAIGHASIASESIDHYLQGQDPGRRPKVDVHHFNLLGKLRETGLAPEDYNHQPAVGTDAENFAIHNYEDRGHAEIVPADQLFLGHWTYVSRARRSEQDITSGNVLGHFDERIVGLEEENTVAEAERCMSCGICFECDNCIIYCPQDAVERVKKDRSTVGRYVDTIYDRCIGCHICADVCPSGYIQMGLGE
ncbi:MAG: NAD(P)-binding protein [Rhodospirillales bacterium]|jgi:NADPH-dependent glutamate synthase beta subunit-like oxidoreductase/Pyruvate/2-oxoacid:ferredoxin oxidoreductase delta subunit|nr:glutamate synthase [Rhodospirillaceae bacterium]MDP6428166.1 NAD(P)-binding protein [Rhodospirillales bacterium]MDP6642951.1 NAD(P)-binding protein [Rhodospirillales bacterium]